MSQAGYWGVHEYRRRSVQRDVEGFVGWGCLMELVEACGSELEAAFVSALFLTGGRVGEVLGLRGDMFSVEEESGVLVVRDMPLSKRYLKLEEKPGGGWETVSVEAVRRPFPILLCEPPASILRNWVERHTGLLFKSPRSVGRPLSRAWAYKLTQRLEDATGISCWPHAFRGWRASQLVSDYGFQVLDLVDFFSWRKVDMAVHYSRRGWVGLLGRMRPLARYV